MRTADAALREHGFSGEQLLKLSRKAAVDALRRHGAHLDQDRFDDLADYMLEVGVRYAARYEPRFGLGISTFLYRRMRIRYTDWLRHTLGDTLSRGPSKRIRPGGRLWPLDEQSDSSYLDPGYAEVEAGLSVSGCGAADAISARPSPAPGALRRRAG